MCERILNRMERITRDAEKAVGIEPEDSAMSGDERVDRMTDLVMTLERSVRRVAFRRRVSRGGADARGDA